MVLFFHHKSGFCKGGELFVRRPMGRVCTYLMATVSPESLTLNFGVSDLISKLNVRAQLCTIAESRLSFIVDWRSTYKNGNNEELLKSSIR
uniref:Uncharacterized protein n=1 Tax=Solanum lycopersicum TaxID=4081 RepID=A0A3Q7ERY9_SOLLC